ncbi:hypothetical protein GJU40_14520 [Bacillus lacus]|uniref:YtxH domain-containing protein n=1 Tax=Metabacillus lacus TaxID=1983721 RepID=A0A7X2J0Z4_9BACI|nr:YtxH domain-containing protein [Metabacillus lacus]MRX73360.1 hypothetical protein [Metabacillus lacus]
MGLNKLFKSILVGAAAGAVLSLLDKPTRTKVIESGQRAKNKAIDIYQNPESLAEQVRTKIDETRSTVDSLQDDWAFYNEKFQELKKTTPQVLEFIQETKEIFQKKSS